MIDTRWDGQEFDRLIGIWGDRVTKLVPLSGMCILRTHSSSIVTLTGTILTDSAGRPLLASTALMVMASKLQETRFDTK